MQYVVFWPRQIGQEQHGSMGKAFLCGSLIGGAGSLAPLRGADSGTVTVVHGEVRIERAGVSQPLRVGDPVQEKDRIIVPAQASTGVTLRDDTRISVGPRSTLVINRFQFDP